MPKKFWLTWGIALSVGACAWAQEAAPSTEAKPAAKPKAAEEAKPAPKGQPKKNALTQLGLPAKRPAQPRVVQRWGAIDADKDGKATMADIQKVLPDFPAKRFAELDKNKDGILETSEHPKPGEAGPKRAGDANQGARSLAALLNNADTDKDGKVTEAEFKAHQPNAPQGRFAELDKNKDGALSKEDVPPSGGPAAMKLADTDGDGKVSKEEFQKRFTNLPEDRFAKLDKNSDGFLDEKDRALSPQAPRQSPRAWEDVVTNIAAQSDADKDGKVTFEEYSKGKENMPRAAFDALDTNKDGVLSKDDKGPAANSGPARRANSPQEGRERFKRADKDGDGKLTMEEAKAEFPGITKERFKERDTNGDGKLGPDDRASRPATE